jgi:pilus assembly protein CpaB
LRRRTLTIALAGLLALVGVVAVLAYARQANNRAVEGLKAEAVLAATGAIRAGTSLGTAQNEHLLTTEKVPASSLSGVVPVQRVTDKNRNLVVSGPVGSGQLLLQNMLASAASATASGSLPIPAGMVAVTVQMCVQEAVADYITPGSDVAVFDTYTSVNGKVSAAQRSCDVAHTGIPPPLMITRIVLTRAKVLAVGVSPAATGTSAGSPSTVTDPTSTSVQGSVLVTLAVGQADAERLISIDELGLPYMALLTPDSKTMFDNPAHITNVLQP